jgi:hypothetical protein
MKQVRKFMLDSLPANTLTGGIYSKKDLLTAINDTGGDSLYIMLAWLDCVLNEGNGMFITSPITGKVRLVSRYRPYCAPCPGQTCCPQAICAPLLNGSCIKFKRLITPEATTETLDANGNPVQ